MELTEVYELLVTVKGVVDVIAENTDGELIPQEVIDVLQTFDNGGDPDNDVELLLNDIRDSLMYDEENTALYEISSRLELIDARLDTEFTALNEGISFICTACLILVICKFFSWVSNTFSF